MVWDIRIQNPSKNILIFYNIITKNIVYQTSSFRSYTSRFRNTWEKRARIHRPDYTPNHQRSQLGTLPRRIVGVSMTNGTRHDPCIPCHWAMRCPAWTLTRTSHNRVVNKIRPYTDVASISSVLHLVWPLAQSLSSMVVPTRSQNSGICEARKPPNYDKVTTLSLDCHSASKVSLMDMGKSVNV